MKKKRQRGGASLQCPKCGESTHVRWTKRDGPRTVLRGRECLSKKCGYRYESTEEANER